MKPNNIGISMVTWTKKRWPTIGPVAIFLLACGLFGTFRSLQWDINGIIEAAAVDSAGIALFSPNHLLYRPLGYLALVIGRLAGYDGDSIRVLQYLTVILAALGVASFYKLMQLLTKNNRVALLATLLLATSWSYWTFSTDAYYVTPSAAAVIGALIVFFVKPQPTCSGVILLGVLTSLSILFWQANVFLVPIMLLALLWKGKARGRQASLVHAGLFLSITAAIVGTFYLGVGTRFFGVTRVSDLMAWLLSHEGKGHVSLWGAWSLDRIPTALRTALASFIPVWEGLGLSTIMRGTIPWDRLLAPLSLLAMLTLGAATLLAVIRKRTAIIGSPALLTWLLLGYCVYIPFIIWWDPFEPKWFVVPNIFLVAAMGVVWGGENKPRYLLSIGVMVAVIGAANFTYTIWPRHSRPNAYLQLAACFVENTDSQDTVILTDWNWFSYADYFYEFRGSHVSLLGDLDSKARKLELIRTALDEARQLDGHVYMLDWDTLPAGDLSLSQGLTGLTVQDFQWLEQRPAFACQSSDFVEITKSGDK